MSQMYLDEDEGVPATVGSRNLERRADSTARVADRRFETERRFHRGGANVRGVHGRRTKHGYC